MSIVVYQVDAFTEQPFKGNPAGVCLLQMPLEQEMMQSIAAEMNLSETAFVYPYGTTPNSYYIRYFTPSTEVELCGHATLATAKVLFSNAKMGVNTFTFYTLNDVLIVQKDEGKLVMNFPQFHTTEINGLPHEFWQALALSDVREVRYAPDIRIMLIHLGEGGELLDARPSIDLLKKISLPIQLDGFVLTTQDTRALPYLNTYHFMSRCFFPWVGVDEDPVTGVAHSVLAPYWANILNRNHFKAFQASKRGGELTLTLLDNHRLAIAGEACIIFKATTYF